MYNLPLIPLQFSPLKVWFGSFLHLWCLHLSFKHMDGIILTFKIFLSTNSNISQVLDWLWFVDYFYYWICLFASLAWLITFDWLPDVVNFILLGSKYFCIPIDLLALCSRMQLSSLGKVLFFWVCDIFRKDWSTAYSTDNYFSVLRQDSSACITHCPINPDIIQYGW